MQDLSLLLLCFGRFSHFAPKWSGEAQNAVIIVSDVVPKWSGEAQNAVIMDGKYSQTP